MTQHEYIFIAVSIILGLAIRQYLHVQQRDYAFDNCTFSGYPVDGAGDRHPTAIQSLAGVICAVFLAGTGAHSMSQSAFRLLRSITIMLLFIHGMEN